MVDGGIDAVAARRDDYEMNVLVVKEVDVEDAADSVDHYNEVKLDDENVVDWKLRLVKRSFFLFDKFGKFAAIVALLGSIIEFLFVWE